VLDIFISVFFRVFTFSFPCDTESFPCRSRNFSVFSVTVSGFNGKSHEIGIKVLTKPGRFPLSIPREKYTGNEGRNAGKRCRKGGLRSIDADDYLEGLPHLPFSIQSSEDRRWEIWLADSPLGTFAARPGQPAAPGKRLPPSPVPLPSIRTKVRLLPPPGTGWPSPPRTPPRVAGVRGGVRLVPAFKGPRNQGGLIKEDVQDPFSG
jgi:hypothetical protein